MLHLHLFQFLLQHLDVIVALDKLCPLIHILVLPFDIRPDGIDTKLNSEVCDSKVDTLGQSIVGTGSRLEGDGQSSIIKYQANIQSSITYPLSVGSTPCTFGGG